MKNLVTFKQNYFIKAFYIEWYKNVFLNVIINDL